MQPAFALAAIPDAVFGAKHPTTTLAVQDREVADCHPERPRLETPHATLLDEAPVAQLGFREWVDGHAQSIAVRAV